ncbi:MAG: AAA family ATPase, partial [Lachnospiraceae bacterium]|nr:AAA family ATPase [Lachnospiraceae bacterium]
MGIYLNPRKRAFQKALKSQIYVDKSELIAYTNKVLDSEQQYVCVSRPRRFGKSMAANMLAAYYGRDADSKAEFEKLKIGKDASFLTHLNQYNVIFLNMQDFLSDKHDVEAMKIAIEKNILWDLLEEYPDIRYYDSENLVRTLSDIYNAVDIPFVFIIDEWDCIFREKKTDKEAQKVYLDFLRNLLKDKQYVALAYMTGILPIKKYGTHSALNMFDEFSMTNPKQLAEFVGFTESEVEDLCCQYGMDFEETKRWYDGYRFENLE